MRRRSLTVPALALTGLSFIALVVLVLLFGERESWPTWVFLGIVAFGAATGMTFLVSLGRDGEADRRRLAAGGGYCPDCAYDCRVTPDRCPECGTVLKSPSTS